MQNRVIVSSSFFLEDSGWVRGRVDACLLPQKRTEQLFEINLEATCVISSISFSFRVDALDRGVETVKN